VASLTSGEPDTHGLGIAHLADHDDIRRLADSRPESRRKIHRIDANLDLLDDASLM
jgi:hypothetical protein